MELVKIKYSDADGNFSNAGGNATNDKAGVDTLVDRAEALLQTKDTDRAKAVFSEIAEIYPEDHRGYWGLAKVGLIQFPNGEGVEDYFNKAIALADDPAKVKMLLFWDKYNAALDEINALQADEEKERKEAKAVRKKLHSVKAIILISIVMVIFAVSFILGMINISRYTGTGIDIFVVFLGVAAVVSLVWLICVLLGNKKTRQKYEAHQGNADEAGNKINVIIDEFRSSLSFTGM